MATLYDFKIFFYLTFILFICVLPVYLFRKNWREVRIIAYVIIYFFILNKDLIWGRLGVYHDTWIMYEQILMIFKQWLDSSFPIGWNPYMNAGEPLYLFSNFFLWAPWVVFCWLNKFINLNLHILFNLFLVFHFVNFCVGGLLLFLLLYEDFRVALFSFMALILSGMFIVNLGQMAGLIMIYYFPYILFGFILFWRQKNIYGLIFTIIFLGIAFNHYFPQYIVLVASICIFFLVAFNLKLLPPRLRLLKSQCRFLLLALVIFLLAASPALFLIKEAQDYVSPIRADFSPHGVVKLYQKGHQPYVYPTPLWGYRILLEQSVHVDIDIHHAFYFGIIPLLLIPLALIRWRNKYFWTFFASALVIIFLARGNDFWGCRLLVKYAPGFNMMKHVFGLIHFVCFFLLCLCGYGLKELLREDSGKIANLSSSILIPVTFLIMVLISKKFNVLLFGSLGVFGLISLIAIKQFFSGKAKRYGIGLLYLLILLFLIVDVTIFYMHHYRARLLNSPAITLTNIVYPVKRTLYPPKSYPPLARPIPPDFSPLIFKKASLTHPNRHFIFFRHRRINEMLRLFVPQKSYEPALGVEGPIFYFTQNAKILPADISPEQFIQTIYEDFSRSSFADFSYVYFSEEDIDFSAPNKEEKPGEWRIDYRKIDDPNRVEILVKAPAEGYLVRLENFHPGWQAFIDGKKTRIYRANYAFQAIRVPQGSHKISFIFSSVYPLLMHINIFSVFLNWLAFNLYLFNIGKKNWLASPL